MASQLFFTSFIRPHPDYSRQSARQATDRILALPFRRHVPAVCYGFEGFKIALGREVGKVLAGLQAREDGAPLPRFNLFFSYLLHICSCSSRTQRSRGVVTAKAGFSRPARFTACPATAPNFAGCGPVARASSSSLHYGVGQPSLLGVNGYSSLRATRLAYPSFRLGTCSNAAGNIPPILCLGRRFWFSEVGLSAIWSC